MVWLLNAMAAISVHGKIRAMLFVNVIYFEPTHKSARKFYSQTPLLPMR